MSGIWIIKLLLAHLLTDFVVYGRRWRRHIGERHFLSPYLYLHTAITAIVAWIFIGVSFWPQAIVIFVTHALIEGGFSYRPRTVRSFLLAQAAHLVVLLYCWQTAFVHWPAVIDWANAVGRDYSFWVVVTGFVFLSFPAGVLIDQLTRKWRVQLEDASGLADAGKWIGILERFIILVFLLYQQYAAIGLLITAKGLLRFNEKDKQEQKTEYVLIGSLISVAFALLTGVLVNHLLR